MSAGCNSYSYYFFPLSPCVQDDLPSTPVRRGKSWKKIRSNLDNIRSMWRHEVLTKTDSAHHLNSLYVPLHTSTYLYVPLRTLLCLVFILVSLGRLPSHLSYCHASSGQGRLLGQLIALSYTGTMSQCFSH